jgi:predicted transcriptional regulator
MSNSCISLLYTNLSKHCGNDPQMVSETQVINALFQEKFFVVFDLIAIEGGDRKRIINSLGLTPKQYHSRISALRKSGLVEKINEKYFLTSFGKVVHEARQLIESAIKDYWKFKAIDAIWFELPKKERNKIIDSLIDNEDIRELLFRSTRPVIAKQNQRESIGSN